MENLIKNLDLSTHIQSLTSYFARPKDVVLEGDINIHFKIIQQLDKFDLKNPPKIENLDTPLVHLQKQGVLKIYESFEFIKIINYFLYLKRFDFDDALQSWIEKIIIPLELSSMGDCFTTKGEIATGYSQDLDLINEKITSNKESIKQKLYSVVNNKSLQPYLVDHQIHLVNGEQTLMVRGGFNHVLKAKVLDRSQNGFFYVLPHSVSDLKQTQSDLLNYKEEILYNISKDFSNKLRKHLMFLKFINKEFDRFDHYLARVNFARINDLEFIKQKASSKTNHLIDFKHPAIKDPKSVSIDFSKSVVMITGVNAGGKTMLLKSILSAVFMSKYLIPFSCNPKTIIGNFKNISAILDDPQNVKNDISTFAGRMVQFSKLFNRTNAIVGVDEIELGTDSDEAASLFKVIIEELIQKDIKIIITTHHKRLAALMANNANVELIAALYDEENRKPTYEFLQGTIGRSYAFETALRYNIPLSVVKKAKEVYGEDKDRLNELIERSSDLEREYKQKIQILDEGIKKNQQLKKSLQEQKEQIDQNLQSKLYSLEKEYKEAIEEVKKAIKLNDQKEQHRILNHAHKKKETIKIEKQVDPIELKEGDRVKYNNTKGVLKSIKGKKGIVETDDGMKLHVVIADLKRSGNILKPKPKNINLQIQKPQTGHVKLDLHGLRAQEAIEKLDKFLSDSLLAGFDEVLVYHGVGTGKLAYAVKKFLSTYPAIKSFNDASAKEGGYGAQVIKL
ncbi:MAG: endonuclease MutS2 [Campylobacterales bacterium]|nr:endonuclease MutS2 [Campylobacterales bacterium]